MKPRIETLLGQVSDEAFLIDLLEANDNINAALELADDLRERGQIEVAEAATLRHETAMAVAATVTQDGDFGGFADFETAGPGPRPAGIAVPELPEAEHVFGGHSPTLTEEEDGGLLDKRSLKRSQETPIESSVGRDRQLSYGDAAAAVRRVNQPPMQPSLATLVGGVPVMPGFQTMPGLPVTPPVFPTATASQPVVIAPMTPPTTPPLPNNASPTPTAQMDPPPRISVAAAELAEGLGFETEGTPEEAPGRGGGPALTPVSTPGLAAGGL